MGLHRVCPVVRFLGSYPKADGVPNAVRPHSSAADYATAQQWLSELLGEV
jgi:prephenate dehydratase